MNQLEKAVADLRHAYHQLTEGVVKDQAKFADGLIAPAIYRIEQALTPGEPTYSIKQVDRAYELGLSEGKKDAPQPQPKQEPVAWIWKYANGEEEVVFVPPRHIDATYVDAPSTITPLYTAPQPQPEQEPVAWQPIETAPKGRIVLVHYKNRLGNGRTMRARYYLPETLDSDTTESGWADEGWYEESEAYEYLMPLDGEPTHWMPLPPEPGTAPQPQPCNPAEDGVCEALECCKHGVGDGACKECHDETARPSQDRRADALLAQQERDTALLRQLHTDLEILKTAMRVGPPEYDWQDYGEMLDATIEALKERLK